MAASSSLPAMDYIALAGCYSFRSSDLTWESLPFGHKPRFAGETSTLYQGTLRNREQGKPVGMPLRVTLCGIAWLGEQTFGRGPLSDLLALQQMLNAPSWSAALTSLRRQWQDEQEGETEIDEQGIREFVSALQQDGWILINEHKGASHGF